MTNYKTTSGTEKSAVYYYDAKITHENVLRKIKKSRLHNFAYLVIYIDFHVIKIVIPVDVEIFVESLAAKRYMKENYQ